MSEALVTACISAGAILSGAVIGAGCSFYISKHATNKKIEIQNKIFEEDKLIKGELQKKIIYENANIIRLDICTAIFQSIRSLKLIIEDKGYPIYIPVNKQYSKILASLNGVFDLKEMSYIYQLYGIIEKINNDVRMLDYTQKNKYKMLKIDYEMLLIKLYGEKFIYIMENDIEKITYEQLIDNEFIKNGYKISLMRLNNICNRKAGF